jgi:mRNA-degrading endonuclease RelE of RelBE toxin-antitoxin system
LIPWGIVYARSALRELQKLNPAERSSVLRGIQRYAETDSGDTKKLQVDKTSTWRLRVGDWRVFFDKDTQERVLLIKSVRNRKDSY